MLAEAMSKTKKLLTPTLTPKGARGCGLRTEYIGCLEVDAGCWIAFNISGLLPRMMKLPTISVSLYTPSIPATRFMAMQRCW